MTVVTGFVQVRYFGRMFRVLRAARPEHADPNQITARQALLVSVGGRVGGGNIAGVAVAITLGGPGAVFWMWAIALVGMRTSLVECTLAQVYKTRRGRRHLPRRPGRATSGAAWAPATAGWRCCTRCCLIGSVRLRLQRLPGQHDRRRRQRQPGRRAAVDRRWRWPAVTGFIVYGGIQRIAKVADVVVPVMALTYIAMALLVIVLNIDELPRVLGDDRRQRLRARGGRAAAAWARRSRRACAAGCSPTRPGLGSAPNVAATADVLPPDQPGHHAVAVGVHRHHPDLLGHRLRDPARQRLRAGRRGRRAASR
ncbi:MAG: alanine:cation symporter family protein [Comamonadaceae bacterium]|nr:alanine:cation symporter family protein [Comamonadaceae bacterium]